MICCQSYFASNFTTPPNFAHFIKKTSKVSPEQTQVGMKVSSKSLKISQNVFGNVQNYSKVTFIVD